MATYRLFCIADKSKSGLTKQVSECLVRLKKNNYKQLSDFLPEIPQELGIRLVFLITDVKALEQKLEKAINVLASDDVPRFSLKEKIFITNNNLKPGKTVFLFPGFGSEFPRMLTGTSSKFKVVSKWMNIFENLHNRTDNDGSIGQDEWLESLLKKKVTVLLKEAQ